MQFSFEAVNTLLTEILDFTVSLDLYNPCDTLLAYFEGLMDIWQQFISKFHFSQNWNSNIEGISVIKYQRTYAFQVCFGILLVGLLALFSHHMLLFQLMLKF